MKNLILMVLVIAFSSCKATAEQMAQRAERKANRIAKRALADSLYLAERNNYMIELQGENFPESQDQDNDHQNE